MDAFFFSLVFFVGVPWVIGWTVRSIHDHQRTMQVLKLQADLHNRLFERFGNDPMLIEFLKSGEQRRIFAAQVPEPIVHSRIPAPYGRVITMIQGALLFLSAGVALLVVKDQVTGRDAPEICLVFGTLGVALGIGALVSAAAVVVVSRLWPRPDAAAEVRP